jgi:hypothetical protein
MYDVSTRNRSEGLVMLTFGGNVIDVSDNFHEIVMMKSSRCQVMVISCVDEAFQNWLDPPKICSPLGL